MERNRGKQGQTDSLADAAIGVSPIVADQMPALAPWLNSLGLSCAPLGKTPSAFIIRLLSPYERHLAGQRDVIIHFREALPKLKFHRAGQPAEISFGSSDCSFGFALIAGLVRPAGRPAVGDKQTVDLLNIAARIADSNATILVQGETGTGKEGVARYIHRMSRRSDQAFIPVNCAALPETMLEAMLFGYVKGSFTGAMADNKGLFRAADGGTLLLDEVSELPLGLQAKLLRVLQEQEVLPIGASEPCSINVRIIAAANRDLAQEVAAKNFRADLYWRLNVVPVTLLPLAQRKQDIRVLAAALLLRHAPADTDFPWLTNSALDLLQRHSWPGNVRELENCLQRAILLHRGVRIEASDLLIDSADLLNPPVITAVVESAPYSIGDHARKNLSLGLADAARAAEHKVIEEALLATNGHRRQAAQRLGISERTLRYRLAGMRTAS
ncbi:MAG: sigma 54-interacting transcriptional regulator [Zymomonas mobilis]|uniref:Two-component system response regulator FlrC n=1 Tax=Zymomonas mobilis TaxID=542 RepID=A0A542W0I5_ZYMMB|nr:sigma 54-interacting transcriptional regulator [Zymomonas mobilis]TQL17095.1 two-component system response regulator FlrC [Zymomonas mobilis]